MSGSAFAVTHHAFSSGAGRTSDGNGSHWSTSKTPSYTKSVSWQHHPIPSLIKNRKVPLWNWFAGLCGAMVVFSEGASASALGVATFQTALISALLLSGLLCDRFGIGVDEKKYFTPYRIIGALFAVIATIFVVSPQWHSTSFILLAILPFLAGLLAGWQPAGNAKVAEATGSMLVSIT